MHLMSKIFFFFYLLHLISANNNYISDYLSYLKKFNKDLLQIHNKKRLNSFIKAHTFINQFNQREVEKEKKDKEKSFTVKLNHFADFTDEELSSLFHEIEPIESFQHSSLKMRKLQDEELEENAEVNEEIFLQASQDSSNLFTMFQRSNKEDLVSELVSAHFNQSLNWASDNNPIGKPITGKVQIQGTCGACWAFVTASSVEIANYIGLELKERSPRLLSQKQSKNYFSNSLLRAKKKNSSTSLSSSSPSYVPSLSVQQLIECDRSYNKGCGGGNPLMGLFYAAENGLVSSDDYPYTGLEGTCHAIPSNVTHYYVSEIYTISPNNQLLIKEALRWGVVTAGVCGTSLSFLYYDGGIYDDLTCCTTQNHALLIVGYDYDEETKRNYWIAQNSWGDLWGEKGFIRIAWTESDTSSGICGIYTTLAQATGGYSLGESRTVEKISLFYWLLSYRDTICTLLAAILIIISVIIAFIITLNSDDEETSVCFCCPNMRRRGYTRIN